MLYRMEFNATLKGDRAIIKYIAFDGAGTRYICRQKTIKGSFNKWIDIYDHIDCLYVKTINDKTYKFTQLVEYKK